MDTTDVEIRFYSSGHCNHCSDFKNDISLISNSSNQSEKLKNLLGTIKDRQKSKEFDVVIGISGGVDSTYLAYLTKEWGLRPLAVHFDNGWNAELAVQNIENILNKLEIELETVVVDWDEFKDFQRAYLKASVIDVEVLTDHGLVGALFKVADQNDVPYILMGMNNSTEGIMPKTWNFRAKNDATNLLDIIKQFGNVPVKSYPLMGYNQLKYYKHKGIKVYSPLNWVNFDKQESMEILKEKLNWRDYGVKHGESTFTKFYQGYILPTKFKVDKRRAHFSTLICSGQISRNEALKIIKIPVYTPDELEDDYEYVIKKLDFERTEFEALMEQAPRSHFNFATHWLSKVQYKVLPYLKPFKKILNPFVNRFKISE